MSPPIKQLCDQALLSNPANVTQGEEEGRQCKRQGKRKHSMVISWYMRQSVGSRLHDYSALLRQCRG